MITKDYIRKNLNKKTKTCKVCIEVPWNRTSTSAIYSTLDASLEDEAMRGILGVVSVEPISFDHKNKTVLLELVVDTQDIDWSE
jgi:hypothetical protein